MNMKQFNKTRRAFPNLFIILLIATALLFVAACAGDDGDAGPAGPAGPAGADGADGAGAACIGTGEAAFTVVLSLDWSQGDSEGDHFPDSPDFDSADGLRAHFAPMSGVTHSADTTFWAADTTPPTMATDGVKTMAETGNPAMLLTEFKADSTKILDELAMVGPVHSGTGANSITASYVWTDVCASAAHPHLTLQGMIAPSPDWFVGISSLDLFDDSDQPKAGLIETVHVYDAGTDKYEEIPVDNTMNNDPQEPRNPIARGVAPVISPGNPRAVTFLPTASFGTLTVTQQD